MAGYRPSHSAGLRLVSLDDRPTILHAVGSPRERLLLSPLVAELRSLDVARQVVVSSEAEDDDTLAGVQELAIADRHLDAGRPAPTHRLADLLAAFEAAVEETAPELVVIAGAGDAGLAAGIAAAKHGIAVVHVESGVRHSDPRRAELHRLLNDRVADTLLAPTALEAENLIGEGIPDTRIHVVGQTDLDVVRRVAPRARARRAWAAHDLPDHGYVLVRLTPEALADPAVAGAVAALARLLPVAVDAPDVPGLVAAGARRVTAGRLLDQVSLVLGAGAVVTDDSLVGDLASALGVACHTLGRHTDRPHTIAAGTNCLLGDDPAAIAAVRPVPGPPTAHDLPPWDGRAAERAARIIVANYVLVDQRREIAAP